MVRIAKVLLTPEFERRAGIHDQMADARQQVLEEAPGQADQDDQAKRMSRGLREAA